MAPAGLTDGDAGFLLCVGASYLHKNRRFALEVWADLRRRGWPGRIVLAGPTPPHGNSLAAEAEFALTVGGLRPDIVTLDAVTEAEKIWLYGHAALVLYPSAVEGFGLVPFEAAAHGKPVLATRRGGLAEVLPEGIAALDGFDVARAADEAWRLLHDPAAAHELVAALKARSSCFTWDRTAELLIGLFTAALRQPRGRTLVFEGEGEHPVGLASREQRARRPYGAARTLERLVENVIGRPRLKSTLSPDGSLRQQMARTVISRARRQLG
jgi:glycosyltransferase involved in cell wall biosynthesis